jgi:uncharacterized protein YdcH (DUF465 family)
MTGDEALISRLIAEDEEFKKMYAEHKGYERELEKLEKKGRLSPSEALQKKRIKKLKLTLKDTMQAIITKKKDS